MIKLILGTLVSVLLIIIAGVTFYWRDTKYDPSASDFLIFFALIPVGITLLLLTPVFIKKIYQNQQEKKQILEAEQARRAEQQENVQQDVEESIEWVELNMLSATSLSAIGENEAHLTAIQDAVSPELDTKLLNSYGLPILSFRIPDLDDQLDEEGNDEHSHLSDRQKRINALIIQQLEQNAETLYQIATHLKNSAMFYDTKLAHEYRMHPAWIDPNTDYEDEPVERTVERVPRLNRLNIHLILPENLFHVWDENIGRELIQEYLNELGIISQQFDTEYHYWGETTAYQDWIKLLKRAQTLDADVSFFIAVDSEIDQETIDDRTWMTEKYIPSEYVSACFLTASQVEVQNLEVAKKIKIALNSNNAAKILNELKLDQAEQHEAEQPFVFVLDDPTEIKSLKKLEHNFADTPIEAQHYLYSKNSLGNTQPLSKVFGFMLSLHINDEMYGYVYSADHQQTQVLVKSEFEQKL